jgi:hypothetical protein
MLNKLLASPFFSPAFGVINDKLPLLPALIKQQLASAISSLLYARLLTQAQPFFGKHRQLASNGNKAATRLARMRIPVRPRYRGHLPHHKVLIQLIVTPANLPAREPHLSVAVLGGYLMEAVWVFAGAPPAWY